MRNIFPNSDNTTITHNLILESGTPSKKDAHKVLPSPAADSTTRQEDAGVKRHCAICHMGTGQDHPGEQSSYKHNFVEGGI